MSEIEYHEGDVVLAVKGGTVIRGRLDHRAELKLTRALSSDMPHLKANGYAVTVIERAKPGLPTEPGAYRDKDDDLWLLDRNGKWGDFSLMELPPSEDDTRTPHRYAPFTRLEPVAETAKKVLARFMDVWVDSENSVNADVRQVAAEFGVTND